MVADLVNFLVATTPGPDNGDDELVRGAWALFSIIALVLTLFVLVIAGLAILRLRRRGAESRRDEAAVETDAWVEAGRRIDARERPTE